MCAALAAFAPVAEADDPSFSAVPTEPGPPQYVHGDAARYARSHPNVAPPFVNDFSCRPSARHPRPVILLHGTDSNAYNDYAMISPLLHAQGYCMYAVNYGGSAVRKSFGVQDMYTSVLQVRDFIAEVRRRTGASEVDVIGYSQGATVGRYVINKLGGSQYVHTWVGLASPSYGGTLYGIAPIAALIPGATPAFEKAFSIAVIQQGADAPFMKAMNAGGDTVPGVRYVTIGTRVDEMIQPFSSIALHGPGATNVVVQDGCPQDLTGHFQMPYDAYTQTLVLNALDPSYQPSGCVFVPLGQGIPEVIAAAH